MAKTLNKTNKERDSGGFEDSIVYKSAHMHELLFTDEPPIGAASGSFFLDLSAQISNLNPQVVNGKSKYKLDKNYTGVAAVSVLTEQRGNGNVVFATYYVRTSERRAKLLLTLKTYNGDKLIEIPGDNNGSVVINDRFNTVGEITGKDIRGHRLRHPISDARVIGWKIINSAGAVIVGSDGTRFEDSGDDMYYFYISMFH